MGNKFSLALVLIVVLGIAGYFVVRAGFFPAAIVNGEFVSRGRFETQLAAAVTYAETAATQDSSVGAVDAASLRIELRRAVLDKIIEDALVARGVREKLGRALDERVAGKLATVRDQIATDDFKAAVSEFYGLDIPDFREFVLVPQAERELLEDALRADARTAESWIDETRRAARVRILISGLKWDGLQVAYVTNEK